MHIVPESSILLLLAESIVADVAVGGGCSVRHPGRLAPDGH